MQRLLFPLRCCRETDEENKLITPGFLTPFISLTHKLCLSFPPLLSLAFYLREWLGCIQIVPELVQLSILGPSGEQLDLFHTDNMFNLLSFLCVVCWSTYNLNELTEKQFVFLLLLQMCHSFQWHAVRYTPFNKIVTKFSAYFANSASLTNW